jgi:hypothetical protein
MEMTVRPFTGLILASLPLYLSGCGLPAGVTVASYAVDGGLMWFTDKSSNDHLLSMMAGQDCAMWRVIKGRQICTDHKPGEENPYNVDYNAPHREVGEGGMVTVYTASRQGGRLLTEQEAVAALRVPPPAAGTSPAVTVASQPAAVRTAELADTAGTASPGVPERVVAGPARKPGMRADKAPRMGKPPSVGTRQVAAAVPKPLPRIDARGAAPTPTVVASQSTALMTGAPPPEVPPEAAR